jgi:hypothetical protein
MIKGKVRVILLYDVNSEKKTGTMETKDIKAEYFARIPLAIHSPVNDNRKLGYVVTQISSGIVVFRGLTKKVCKEFIKLVSGLDWTQKRILKEEREAYYRAIIKLGQPFEGFHLEDDIKDTVKKRKEALQKFYKKHKKVINKFVPKVTRDNF